MSLRMSVLEYLQDRAEQRRAREEAKKLAREEEAEERRNRKWGQRDRSGKWWRFGGQPPHWQRLSFRFSISKGFRGEPIVTPKVKEVHDDGLAAYQPDLEEIEEEKKE
mmetsp:Transcript_7572/g.12545  ORF Transcript_7572/g.12545 Transcript_7572/m.12545 type:complete len:108 (+) Transcript_7572:3-326(+)